MTRKSAANNCNPKRQRGLRGVARSYVGPSLTLRVSIAVAVLAFSSSAMSQDAKSDPPEDVEEKELPLAERTPFDEIRLNARNNKTVMEVVPLKFPGAKVPDPRPTTGWLRFRYAEDPALLYEVKWGAIVEIKFFRDLLLEKANALTLEAVELRNAAADLTKADKLKEAESKSIEAGKKFDEAFFYFDRLIQDYPTTDGLKPAYENYLYDDAGRIFQTATALRNVGKEDDAQKGFHEAYGVVEELLRRNPTYRRSPAYPTVSQVLRHILDGLLTGYVEKRKSYESARAFLDTIAKTYGDQQKPTLEKWHGILHDLAKVKRDQARAFLAAGRARDAHGAVRQMLNIYPTVDGGYEISAEVMRVLPLVMVGVSRPALSFDARRLNDWAARRGGLLTHRFLFEYSSRGPEGGRYLCPLGSIEFGEDGKQMIFQLSRTSTRPDVPRADGFSVARLLRDAANPNHPNYVPAWSQLMGRVSVEDIQKVRVELRYPHILPEAMLQLPLEPLDDLIETDGLYIVADKQEVEKELRYVPNPRYSVNVKRPQLVEKLYTDSHEAVVALRRSEIDIIDRVFPGDVPRLTGNDDIVVQRYEMPSVHMLVPSSHNPFMNNEMFRRALTYAINREDILKFDLLNNMQIPGCETVSGPFPKGVPSGVYRSDPLAYAYNHRISRRSYLPRLAMTLIALAERSVVKPVRERYEAMRSTYEALVKLENVNDDRMAAVTLQFKTAELEYNKLKNRPTLVIAHPADEIPRIACQAIAQQLGLAGVNSLTLELPPGETVNQEGRWLLFSAPASEAKSLETGIVSGPVLKKLKQRQFELSNETFVEEGDGHWTIRDFKDGRSFTAKVEGDQLNVYVNVDLRYEEVFMWEPLVDARKLLSVDGIAGLGSAHSELALRRLDRSVNWSLARRYLFELHSLSQRNAMVIPLWQLVEHYAYRKSLQGPGSRLLSLYQNVREWQISPAKPKSTQAAKDSK